MEWLGYIICIVIGVFLGWILWYRQWKNTEEQLADHKETIGELNEDKISLGYRVVKMEKKIKDLQGEFKKYEDEIESLHKEKEEYNQIEISLNERIDELTGMKKDYEVKVNDQKKTIEDQQTQVTQLESELKKKDSDLALIGKKLETLEEDKDKLSKDVKTFSGSLDVMKKDYKKVTKELEELKKKKSSEQMRLYLDPVEEAGLEKKQDPDLEPLVEKLEEPVVAEDFDKHLEGINKGLELDYVDDLKEVSGIGPKMEKLLNELGVTTFLQLSKFNKEGIDALNARIDTFPGRIERDDWIGQAAKLHVKHHELVNQ